jgi:hypothetical protein
MKKIFFIILFTFIQFTLYGQEIDYMMKIQDVESLNLSFEEINRINILKNSDNFLSVNIIQLGDIETMIKKGSISFHLPNGLENTNASTINLDYQTASSFVWNAKIDRGDVLLIHRDGRTFGQIRKNGKVFDIQHLKDNYATLIEYNMEKLNQLRCAFNDQHSIYHTAPSSLKNEVNQHHKSIHANLELEGTTFMGGSTSGVLVLYTPAAYATGMNLTDLAYTAAGQWLTAQINSGVHSNLEIVGVEELNFVEYDYETDVKRLRDNTEAQQLRDLFEADLVILFTDGNYPGIGGIVSEIGPDDYNAYGIVQVANATSTMTWAHEVGHLFGARHQNDPTPGDAHGHKWSTGWWLWQKNYSSIMHTLQGNTERVKNFSNPYKTNNGQATGVVGESYNAKHININGWVVSDFRFTQSNMSVYIYGAAMADDGDPLIFTYSISNGQSPASYQWEVDIGGGYYSTSTSSSLNFTMPTDQDLDVKLTVTGSDGQVATDYHFVMNSFLDGGPCTICPDSTTFDIALDGLEVLPNGFLIEQAYPNPFNPSTTIPFKLSEPAKVKIEIFDVTGRLVSVLTNQNYEVGRHSIQFNASETLASGIYLVRSEILGQVTTQSITLIK